MNTDNDLKNKIKALYIQLRGPGRTTEQYAEDCGCSPNTLYRIQRGGFKRKPHKELLKKLINNAWAGCEVTLKELEKVIDDYIEYSDLLDSDINNTWREKTERLILMAAAKAEYRIKLFTDQHSPAPRFPGFYNCNYDIDWTLIKDDKTEHPIKAVIRTGWMGTLEDAIWGFSTSLPIYPPSAWYYFIVFNQNIDAVIIDGRERNDNLEQQEEEVEKIKKTLLESGSNVHATVVFVEEETSRVLREIDLGNERAPIYLQD